MMMSQSIAIQVLFQDSSLLVINKPAGLATLPDGYNPSLPHIKSMLEQQFGRLWIVHRLDKDTSGVLLLACSANAHRALNTQFERHQASKVYHALVIGSPDWIETTIELPLRSNGDRQHRTVIDSHHGKPAITHLKVLERFDWYCLLEAIPETGRTHQIRAHLSAVGLFVFGDDLYRPRPTTPDGMITHPATDGHLPSIHWVSGMGLHALSLEINHPLSGVRLKFTAPYPDYLKDALKQLRSSASGG